MPPRAWGAAASRDAVSRSAARRPAPAAPRAACGGSGGGSGCRAPGRSAGSCGLPLAPAAHRCSSSRTRARACRAPRRSGARDRPGASSAQPEAAALARLGERTAGYVMRSSRVDPRSARRRAAAPSSVGKLPSHERPRGPIRVCPAVHKRGDHQRSKLAAERRSIPHPSKALFPSRPAAGLSPSARSGSRGTRASPRSSPSRCHRAR